MRFIIIGCAYAGKTTLAVEISKWMIREHGRPFARWHNHFIAPHLERHLVVNRGAADRFDVVREETPDRDPDAMVAQFRSMAPAMLESFSRHMIWHHLHPSMFHDDPDCLFIDFYYGDAVYAPLYYGYGEPGSFADRDRRARAWDGHVAQLAPDTVLVLVRASASVIRERMRLAPRPESFLQDGHVERVLAEFERQYANALIPRRIAVDTSSGCANAAFDSFLSQMAPHLPA